MRLSSFSAFLRLVCHKYPADIPHATHTCYGTDEFSFHTSGVTLCPTSDYRSGNSAFILVLNFSSLCASIREARMPRILQHATLPIRFPFWISRGMTGCGLNRLIFFLLLAQGRFLTVPRNATDLRYFRTHTVRMMPFVMKGRIPAQVFRSNLHLLGKDITLFSD